MLRSQASPHRWPPSLQIFSSMYQNGPHIIRYHLPPSTYSQPLNNAILSQCLWAANIAPHPEDVYPQPGSPATSTFDSLPNHANPMPSADDALAPSQDDCWEVPTGNISTVLAPFFAQPEGALEHPLYLLDMAAIMKCPDCGVPMVAIVECPEEEGDLFIWPICQRCFEVSMATFATPSADSPRATNTTTEGDPDFPFHSPPAGPVLGVESQLCPPDPYYSTVASPPPTDLGQGIPVEAMGANSDTNLPLSDLPHRPVHKRRKSSFVHQIRGQATDDHSRTCCGRVFYGKSERDRHFKSRHLPPTMACRICDYKQSRKDLFNLHCKKKHGRAPESIESLMVHLKM